MKLINYLEFKIIAKIILSIIVLFIVGCSLTPIPSNIENTYKEAHLIVPKIEEVAKVGDIVFRLGNAPIAGGLINFSETIARATESDFSHAVIVYETREDGIIIVDITETGVTRQYLIDWYIEGTKNVVVKRLKPQYQYFFPKIMNHLKKQVENDYLYDPKFIPNDNRFYCTELVDYCFRDAGCELAPKIRIKDFPKCGPLFKLGCLIGGININNEVVVVGNDKIGLFSSEKLETVLDLRQ